MLLLLYREWSLIVNKRAGSRWQSRCKTGGTNAAMACGGIGNGNGRYDAGTILTQPQSTGQNLKGSGTFAVLRAEWARNLHDKRVEDSVAQYAPDGEFFDPSGGRAHGRPRCGSYSRPSWPLMTATSSSHRTGAR